MIHIISMKKVLITTNHPAPYINKEIEILEKDYEVDVIYRWRKDEYKTWNGFVGREGLYYDQLSLFGFWREYRKHDIAILGGWANWYCLLTIIFSFLFRTKCGVFSDHPHPSIKKNFQFYIRKYILFKSLDYIFCATESTHKFYNNNYGIPMSKLLFFPYTYDDTYTKENEKINAERIEALKNPNVKINIFIANNFIDRKGYNAVVSTFVKLHEDGLLSQYRIKIAGNGELFESVKKQLDALNEDIEFLGWIEADQYTYLMNHCDIYIHASRFEPFGIPPLDALCREKLLIASDGVESVSAMITNTLDGFIFKADSGEELYDILKRVDRSGIYWMGRNGRKKVLEVYSEKTFSNAINAIR